MIDLATNKVVATIADTPGAEGVEYVSELKKFYTERARQHHWRPFGPVLTLGSWGEI